MKELLINRSAVLELVAYLIANTGIEVKQDESLRATLRRLERIPNANRQYVEKAQKGLISILAGQRVTVFKTSVSCNYASPMKATCFQDADTAYVLYSGTPDGGWVQNPISYGADIHMANAADGVSSRIQEDGLLFFNACVCELEAGGFSGRFVIGGHSQGGNVAEYITIVSEYASRIELCVSLDGPNHSLELYHYLLNQYGMNYFRENAKKIIAINGHNDFVNMQGQIDFVFPDNTFHLKTDDVWAEQNGHATFPGWHDLIYMMERDDGGLLPYDAKQGPVGKIMVSIVAAINSLSQEVQEDSSMAIMGLMELMLGSKTWNDLREIGVNAGSIGGLLISEEFIGFMARAVPAIGFKVILSPICLVRTLWDILPKKVKRPAAAFFRGARTIFMLVILPVLAVMLTIIAVIGTVIVGLYWIADVIITLIQKTAARFQRTAS